MKTYNYLILAASVCFMAAACNKEGDGSKEKPKDAIDVTIADSYIPKSAILEDGNVVWSKNETIAINGVDYKLFDGAGSKDASFAPAYGMIAEPLLNTPFYKAACPASTFFLSYVDLPSVINDLGNYNPMYAYGDELNLEFHNTCGVLELTVKGSKTLSSIYLVNVASGLAGRYEFKTSVPEPTTENPNPEPTTTFKNTDNMNGPVEIKFANGSQLSSAGVTYRIPIKAGEFKYLYARFTATDGTIADYTMSTPESSIVIETSQKTAFICTPEFTKPETAGMLPGEFSVSATKKVGFAEGNMWYDGVNKVFCIEPFQFASSPLETSGASSNEWGGRYDITHVSHFFPTSDKAAAVELKSSEPATPAKRAAVGEKLFAVDGGAIEGWTLLTKDEMDYLLNKRVVNGGTGAGKTFKGIKSGKLDNCTMRGLLIYPDNYKGAYNEATWADLKAAGIVYLPECAKCNTKNAWASGLKGDATYMLGDAVSEEKTMNVIIVNGDSNKAQFSTINAETVSTAYPIRLVKVLK